LTTAFDDARDEYLRFYRYAVEHRRKGFENLALEIIIQLIGVDPSKIESLWGVDMIGEAGVEPQLFEVNIDTLTAPGSASLTVGDRK